jgi:serine/threonine protein kinase
LVEDYVPGENLDEFRTRLTQKMTQRNRNEIELKLINVILKLARLLKRLHAKGFYHRDLSVREVVVTKRGNVRLLDFDIAKSPNEDDEVLFMKTANGEHKHYSWVLSSSARDFSDFVLIGYDLLGKHHIGYRPFKSGKIFGTWALIIENRLHPHNLDMIIKPLKARANKLRSKIPVQSERSELRRSHANSKRSELRNKEGARLPAVGQGQVRPNDNTSSVVPGTSQKENAKYEGSTKYVDSKSELRQAENGLAGAFKNGNTLFVIRDLVGKWMKSVFNRGPVRLNHGNSRYLTFNVVQPVSHISQAFSERPELAPKIFQNNGELAFAGIAFIMISWFLHLNPLFFAGTALYIVSILMSSRISFNSEIVNKNIIIMQHKDSSIRTSLTGSRSELRKELASEQELRELLEPMFAETDADAPSLKDDGFGLGSIKVRGVYPNTSRVDIEITEDREPGTYDADATQSVKEKIGQQLVQTYPRYVIDKTALQTIYMPLVLIHPEFVIKDQNDANHLADLIRAQVRDVEKMEDLSHADAEVITLRHGPVSIPTRFLGTISTAFNEARQVIKHERQRREINRAMEVAVNIANLVSLSPFGKARELKALLHKLVAQERDRFNTRIAQSLLSNAYEDAISKLGDKRPRPPLPSLVDAQKAVRRISLLSEQIDRTQNLYEVRGALAKLAGPFLKDKGEAGEIVRLAYASALRVLDSKEKSVVSAIMQRIMEIENNLEPTSKFGIVREELVRIMEEIPQWGFSYKTRRVYARTLYGALNPVFDKLDKLERQRTSRSELRSTDYADIRKTIKENRVTGRVYYPAMGPFVDIKDMPGMEELYRIDVVTPLLATDFIQLVGNDINHISFKTFQELIRKQIASLDITEIQFSENQEEVDGLTHDVYGAVFSYNDEVREIKYYSGTNAKRFVLLEPYDVVFTNRNPVGFWNTFQPQVFESWSRSLDNNKPGFFLYDRHPVGVILDWIAALLSFEFPIAFRNMLKDFKLVQQVRGTNLRFYVLASEKRGRSSRSELRNITSEEKIRLIEKVMSEIEEEIKKEGHSNKYFETDHGNRPYSGTDMIYGVPAIRDLEAKGLMGPNKKFGDIGAGIGRVLAIAVTLTDVKEAVGFEIDPYLIGKGRKAIDRLHELGVLDKERIRWIRGDWQQAEKEIHELDAVYIQVPQRDYDFEPWADFIRPLLRSNAYLYDSIYSNKSGWGLSSSRSELRGKNSDTFRAASRQPELSQEGRFATYDLLAKTNLRSGQRRAFIVRASSFAVLHAAFFGVGWFVGLLISRFLEKLTTFIYPDSFFFYALTVSRAVVDDLRNSIQGTALIAAVYSGFWLGVRVGKVWLQYKLTLRRAAAISLYPASQEVIRLAEQKGITHEQLANTIASSDNVKDLFKTFQRNGLIGSGLKFDNPIFTVLIQQVWKKIQDSFYSQFQFSPLAKQFNLHGYYITIGNQEYHVIGVAHGLLGIRLNVRKIRRLVDYLQKNNIPLVTEQNFLSHYGLNYGIEADDHFLMKPDFEATEATRWVNHPFIKVLLVPFKICFGFFDAAMAVLITDFGLLFPSFIKSLDKPKLPHHIFDGSRNRGAYIAKFGVEAGRFTRNKSQTVSLAGTAHIEQALGELARIKANLSRSGATHLRRAELRGKIEHQNAGVPVTSKTSKIKALADALVISGTLGTGALMLPRSGKAELRQNTVNRASWIVNREKQTADELQNAIHDTRITNDGISRAELRQESHQFLMLINMLDKLSTAILQKPKRMENSELARLFFHGHKILNIGPDSDGEAYGSERLDEENIASKFKNFGIRVDLLSPLLEQNLSKGLFRGRVENMRFPDEKYDDIITIGLFDHFYLLSILLASNLNMFDFGRQLQTFYKDSAREISRVLKKGGRLYCGNYMALPEDFRQALLDAGLKEIVTHEEDNMSLFVKAEDVETAVNQLEQAIKSSDKPSLQQKQASAKSRKLNGDSSKIRSELRHRNVGRQARSENEEEQDEDSADEEGMEPYAMPDGHATKEKPGLRGVTESLIGKAKKSGAGSSPAVRPEDSYSPVKSVISAGVKAEKITPLHSAFELQEEAERSELRRDTVNRESGIVSAQQDGGSAILLGGNRGNQTLNESQGSIHEPRYTNHDTRFLRVGLRRAIAGELLKEQPKAEPITRLLTEAREVGRISVPEQLLNGVKRRVLNAVDQKKRFDGEKIKEGVLEQLSSSFAATEKNPREVVAQVLRTQLEKVGLPIAIVGFSRPAERIASILEASAYMEAGREESSVLTQADAKKMQAEFDAFMGISETTVVEFRVSEEQLKQMADARAELMELSEIARSSVAANANVVARIVVPKKFVGELSRAAIDDKAPYRMIIAGGQVLFVNKEQPEFSRFTDIPAKMTVTAERAGVKGRVFDSARYVDRQAIFNGHKEDRGILAKLYVSSLMALSNKTVGWLSQYDNLVRVRSRNALNATELLIQTIALKARTVFHLAKSA